MKITREADYAVRILICLARAEGAVGSSAIAEKMVVPPRFALKILNKLSHGGFVASTKGVYGGYRLIADPHEVSLYDIVKTIDGEICINNCLAEHMDCERGDKALCLVHARLGEVNRGIVDMLSAVKLSELLG